MLCALLSHLVTSCHIMSYHVISCHIMSCRATYHTYHIMGKLGAALAEVEYTYRNPYNAPSFLPVLFYIDQVILPIPIVDHP